MTKITLLFAIGFITISAVLTGTAQAQVRKCTGPDSKVTYSDFACNAGTAKESGVVTNANTLDGSGMRQDASRVRQGEATDKALREQSSLCKFSYFVQGDEAGQALAAAAKQECLTNIRARVTGEPTNLEAYNRWSDHFDKKSAGRQAAITRAANAANAQTIANSNRDAINGLSRQIQNKTYKCAPNVMGNALECK